MPCQCQAFELNHSGRTNIAIILTVRRIWYPRFNDQIYQKIARPVAIRVQKESTSKVPNANARIARMFHGMIVIGFAETWYRPAIDPQLLPYPTFRLRGSPVS
jgi:hypothetical protein